MDDDRGLLGPSFVEEDSKPMRDKVNRADWQKLRKELKGTWKKSPAANCKKLREYLGPIDKAESEKMDIVMNYLTGTGFRLGKIKHRCIQALRTAISKERKKRKRKAISEDYIQQINEIIYEKVDAIANNDGVKLIQLDSKENDLIEQYVNESNLNVVSIQLNPREAKKVLSGEEALIVRYQRDQDRFEQRKKYYAQDKEGNDLGFEVLVTKVFQCTIDELQDRGVKRDIVEQMYEEGSFPNDQVDLIRIRKVSSS